MKNYISPPDALNDLKERGYVADFSTDTVCLYCGELDIRLDPEDFHIDEVYTFEGDSGTDDNSSVIYAITSATGVKGILTDTHGANSEHLGFQMAKKLQEHHAVIS